MDPKHRHRTLICHPTFKKAKLISEIVSNSKKCVDEFKQYDECSMDDSQKVAVTAGFLYCTLSSTLQDSHNLTEESSNKLYIYELKNDKILDPKLLSSIFVVSLRMDELHKGGKLLIGPDQNLYLSSWGLCERIPEAQNNQTRAPPDSTVIYMATQRGNPAPDNPSGKNKPVNKLYAYIICNSFGMIFDSVTGKPCDTEKRT